MTSHQESKFENRKSQRVSSFVFRLLIAQRHYESARLDHKHDHNKQANGVCLFKIDQRAVQFLTTFRKLPHGVAAWDWRTMMEVRGRRGINLSRRSRNHH